MSSYSPPQTPSSSAGNSPSSEHVFTKPDHPASASNANPKRSIKRIKLDETPRNRPEAVISLINSRTHGECWHCAKITEVTSCQVITETANYQDYRHHNLIAFPLDNPGNRISLCRVCSVAFHDATGAGCTFLPTNLDFFIEYEIADFQRRQAEFNLNQTTSQDHPRRCPTRDEYMQAPPPLESPQCRSGNYKKFQLKMFLKGLSLGQYPRPRIWMWKGEPMASVVHGMSAILDNPTLSSAVVEPWIKEKLWRLKDLYSRELLRPQPSPNLQGFSAQNGTSGASIGPGGNIRLGHVHSFPLLPLPIPVLLPAFPQSLPPSIATAPITSSLNLLASPVTPVTPTTPATPGTPALTHSSISPQSPSTPLQGLRSTIANIQISSTAAANGKSLEVIEEDEAVEVISPKDGLVGNVSDDSKEGNHKTQQPEEWKSMTLKNIPTSDYHNEDMEAKERIVLEGSPPAGFEKTEHDILDATQNEAGEAMNLETSTLFYVSEPPAGSD